MADEDNMEDLTNARRVLIEMRRNWIKTIAAGYDRGKTEDAIKGLIDVQHAIDVIERATSSLQKSTPGRQSKTTSQAARKPSAAWSSSG
jgi:hypothetical protein